MDLNQLITERKARLSTPDQVTKLLIAIKKLDTKRESSAFQLQKKIQQLQLSLTTSDRSDDTALRHWLDSYSSEIAGIIKAQSEAFGNALAEGLTPLGIKLRGQYPRLQGNLYAFVVDSTVGRCRIWYGPEQEVLADTDLEAEKTVDAVRKAQSSLGSQLEPEALQALIRRAYLHARLDHPNGPIPILAVLPYVATFVQSERFRLDPRRQNYRSYGKADFSFDMYRVRSATGKFRLTIATRQQTNRRSDFLWVPTRLDTEGGAYFATIEFFEEK